MSITLAQGAVVRQGQGKQVWCGDVRIERKTHGVFEFESPADSEIPAHVHANDDELHYLIEGTATYTMGDETFEAASGSLIYLPKAVPHALKFGKKGGRWLWMTREKNEGLFDEPIVIPVTEPDAQRRALEVPEELVAEVFAKYGMEFVG